MSEAAGERDLHLRHGSIHAPAFLPDGTVGVVRAVDAADLTHLGIQGVVMSTFHLMQNPGAGTIAALGGLHAMTGWGGPIITDSGGFQAYSVVRQQPKRGSVTDEGIRYRPAGRKRKFLLTPEKAIQLQVDFGADIAICLDEPTHVDDSMDIQRSAVARTVAWARRCRTAFDQQMQHIKLGSETAPKLFAVVQGGGSKELRRHCAEQLLDIGFDGFGYGGWPLDRSGKLLTDMLAFTRELIPQQFPMHALGVGHPENIEIGVQLGYQIFDSALPTRDARRGRLYSFTHDSQLEGEWFKFIYIEDERHRKDTRPVCEHCDCATQRYSRGYLHHLFHLGDHAYFRLATLHNLCFMRRLEERLANRLSPFGIG